SLQQAAQPPTFRKPRSSARPKHSAHVEDFRTTLVIVVIIEVVVIDIVRRLDASTSQRPLIIKLLQSRTRLFFDLLIEISQCLSVGRILSDAQRPLIEIAHDRLAQLFGALTLQCRDDKYRTFPVETLDHLPHALSAPLLTQLISLVQHQPTITL